MLLECWIEVPSTVDCKTLLSKVVQLGDLSFGFGEANFTLGFLVLAMSCFVACQPFLVAMVPYESNKATCPIGTVVEVCFGDALPVEMFILVLLPLNRPSAKDQLIPADGRLSNEQWV